MYNYRHDKQTCEKLLESVSIIGHRYSSHHPFTSRLEFLLSAETCSLADSGNRTLLQSILDYLAFFGLCCCLFVFNC